MVINALNSGANVFMADFEDANSPTWSNMVEGQLNLQAAIDRTLTYTNPEGKYYQLNEQLPVLMVRPRGWHLDERHLAIRNQPISASLFDFGLFFFHNARRLIDQGAGPYFYLPKLESHLEARLWNDVFSLAQDQLGIPRGTIKATVLIETILAAFAMDEILYELRDHIAGLNGGRWDYIFSIIKKFRNRPDILPPLPDRAQITMTVPFMRAYAQLLVQTCHRRGAQAIGGMAAFIPSRNQVALAKVREDKLREAGDGFDGTWVAHPDLVPIAQQIFDQPRQSPSPSGRRVSGRGEGSDDSRATRRSAAQTRAEGANPSITPSDLLNFSIPNAQISRTGVRSNISIALQYLKAWLQGQGAVAINNLMEDTATAEISRAQLWQWIHRPNAVLDDGSTLSIKSFRELLAHEANNLRQVAPSADSVLDSASQLVDRLATDDHFAEFLTLEAAHHLASPALTGLAESSRHRFANPHASLATRES
jgi:malate synthase